MGNVTKEAYDTTNRIARRTVHHARKDADKTVYENIDPKSSEMFRLANQMRRENVDFVGDKPVRNDARGMSLNEEAKQRAYREETHHLLPGEIK